MYQPALSTATGRETYPKKISHKWQEFGDHSPSFFRNFHEQLLRQTPMGMIHESVLEKTHGFTLPETNIFAPENRPPRPPQ